MNKDKVKNSEDRIEKDSVLYVHSKAFEGTDAPVHTFKTMPVGDGSLYQWAEFDEKGVLVKNSAQMYPSEADAEKAMRTIATGEVEVSNVKNINFDSNQNVKLVHKDAFQDRFYGMTPVEKSIESVSTEEDAAKNEKTLKDSKGKTLKEQQAKEDTDTKSK